MKKHGIINKIIYFLVMASMCTIVAVFVFPIIQEKLFSNQEASIQISQYEVNNIEETKVDNYNMENIKPAGETNYIKPLNNNGEYRGTKNFYSQLDENAKIIYDAFEANVDNLKTGTYKIQFNGQFDNLLKQDHGNETLNDEFQRAWDAFAYDRPDVFYLNPRKFSLTVETTRRGLWTTYTVYISQGNNDNYLDDGFTGKDQIDEYINTLQNLRSQFKSQMEVMGSDYDRVKSVHDWIVDNIEYDVSMTNTNRYNIYGALVERTVVCEGYAKLLKYVLDESGIECVLASGIATNSEGATERHMWNYVKLDGKWYAVDCTWDDPIIIGKGKGKISDSVKYKYFLKGSDTFSKDHVEESITEKSTSLNYPELSTEQYIKR